MRGILEKVEEPALEGFLQVKSTTELGMMLTDCLPPLHLRILHDGHDPLIHTSRTLLESNVLEASSTLRKDNLDCQSPRGHQIKDRHSVFIYWDRFLGDLVHDTLITSGSSVYISLLLLVPLLHLFVLCHSRLCPLQNTVYTRLISTREEHIS